MKSIACTGTSGQPLLELPVTMVASNGSLGPGFPLRAGELMSQECIRIRGARVHNLRAVDLEIPHRMLVALTGVSGSGKTSLGIHTLHAEGRRRYVASLSSHARAVAEAQIDLDARRRGAFFRRARGRRLDFARRRAGGFPRVLLVRSSSRITR